MTNGPVWDAATAARTSGASEHGQDADQNVDAVRITREQLHRLELAEHRSRDVAGERDRYHAELEQLRTLVAPVAERWMAERTHVVGLTHEARDALNALAEGWSS